jgi:HK97 family phage major capsid protein/HK97 family phage prohead protease
MIYQGVQIDTKPTQAMADEAEKGLRWREEYGRGGTLVGVARANQLRRRDVLSVKTIKRMKAYFDRHAVDMDAPKNRDPDATGYPGAGLIAWLLWGGDSGKSWAERKVAEIRKIEERQMDTEQQRHILGYEETENSIIIEFSKAEEEAHGQDDDSGASSPGVDDARPYPNEHAARIEDPDRFVRFRRAADEGGPGVDFIFGVDREGVSQVQAIRFDAERYTAAEARAWLAEHDFEPVEFEEATGEERGADEKDDEIGRDAASVSLSYRSGSIERAWDEEDDRRVRLAFSSEQPVERDFGFEVLDHSTDGVRLEFLNSGRAPLLLDHDARQQIGVVERVEIDGSARSARATVRLGRGSLAEEIYRDIQDGIRANISVGYRVLGMKRTDEEIEGRSIYRVSWEPMEISIVSIPADRSTAVGVGRSIEVKETKMTEEIKNEEVAQAPTRNERKEIAEILSLGTRHQQRELAERAIHEGRTLEQFRGELLGALESKPLEKPLELTPKEERSYSLLRAIRAAGAQNWAEAGFEREVSDEIARRKGQDARGFWVPEQGWNVRTVKAVTGSSGSGANTIGEDYRPGNFIEALVSQSVVGTLGVQVLQGLQGDVAIPKMSASTSAGWIAEAGSVGNNEPTYAQVTMSPKTLANKVAVTRKMLIQSDPSVEQTVRNNITRVFAAAIDAGLLQGSGSSGQPTGILNTSGIGDVSSAGTSGNAALTYGNVVDIWSEVAADNALVGQLSWVTHPRVVGKLMQTLVESSTDSRMIMMDPTNLLGYNVVQTTQMPSSAPYALLFGNFSDALLGFYSGLDVVVDPYASAGNATTNLYFYQDVDVAVAHAESFAAAQDVTVA